jgi:zinc protease
MRTHSCLAAISVVGMSCAAGGSHSGGGRERVVSRRAATDVDHPVLVSEGALGPLAVKKWRLPNGLELILLPDPSATSVAYMTWFRVGSRNEDAAAGETGLAHLFEHLMFTQTKDAREPGEFDRRMEEAGANVNAMTFYDFTAYVDEVPPEALELAIGLEADRMVNLALTEEQVRTERDVVAEERLGSVEDSVDGVLDEVMYAKAFRTHPYRNPVIGHMKDIKAVTRDRATRFYRTFYTPENAVVVVAGRFEADEVLAAVAAAYGKIPRYEALPADQIAPERAPAAEVRTEIVRPVPADRLGIGFPAPALGGPDRAAFEVIVELLTGGPSARLHRRLVIETEIASSVDGGASPTRDPGLFALWVQMRRGHRAEEAEAIVDKELAQLAGEAVADKDLEKAKNRLETAFWRSLSSSEGKANQLGELEVVAGDYRKLFTRAEELAKVSAADVRRVAESYLGGRARSVVVARPKPAAASAPTAKGS